MMSLDEQKAHAVYNVCVSCVVRMRDPVLSAPDARDSFDAWAKEILDVVRLGFLDNKDDMSIANVYSEQSADPGRETVLELPVTSRSSIMRTFLLLVLTATKRYDARTRVLLRHLASELSLPFPSDYELSTSETLQQPENAIKETKEAISKREEGGRTWRNWKIGLAATAGAVAIGVTGGLAAPLVGAGLGSILGAVGLGTTAAGIMVTGLASTGVLMGSLFGAYGGKMAGEMVARRTKEVSDFEFIPIHLNNRLHITIPITGWLNSEADVVAPWTVIDDTGDVHALQWETKALLDLGSAFGDMIQAQAIGVIKSQIIKRTVLATLMSALWPLGLLKLGQLIDNPWHNASDLAKKTGIVLADVLCEKVQGERPVSLIGYSLGARVIYYCLLELAERKQYGLIENVFVFGLCASAAPETWTSIRQVVAGRLVNGYSTNDWLLAFLYRTMNIQWGIAGLQPVDVDGIENIDITMIVEGHLKYRGAIGECLEAAAAEEMNKEQIIVQKAVLRKIESQESASNISVDELLEQKGAGNAGIAETVPDLPPRPPQLPPRAD
ncbi:hypothetical protein BC832DRAFT_448156 [Gaertneriomyces semiglobifer]|nr:hypothetical protein BC832DRAFT_448156 [Gaertneriomyces semiglobifer]